MENLPGPGLIWETARIDAAKPVVKGACARYLSVVVEVPQVKMAHSIHTRKQRRVSGRPHDVVDVIRVVLERVQRLVVLKERNVGGT